MMQRRFRKPAYALTVVSLGSLSILAVTPSRVEASSGNHACVITAESGIKCWGANTFGQLGSSSAGFDARDVPEPYAPPSDPVTGLPPALTGFTDVTMGGQHTCGRTSSGGAKCWGRSDSGQIGDGNALAFSQVTAVDVVGAGGVGLLTGVAQLAAGGRHTCAVLTDGGVKCWGSNSHGQLGNSAVATHAVTPVDVLVAGTENALAGAVRIAAGEAHTCAVLATGGVTCWGANANGQLGDGSFTDQRGAVDVTGLGSGAVQVTTGASHSCALLTNGMVKCWGNNDQGQIGNGLAPGLGNPNDYNTPQTVVAGFWGFYRDVDDPRDVLINVILLSSGARHSCALLVAGELMCWGSSDQGQLGFADLNHRLIQTIATDPWRHLSISGVAQIATGDGYTCVMMTSGLVQCAGQMGPLTMTLTGPGYPYASNFATINVPTASDPAPLSRCTGAIALGDAVILGDFNQPPMASVCGGNSGDEGAPIPLRGMASDSNGDALTFAWTTSNELCTFSDATVITPTVTCADDWHISGSITVTLTVSDGSPITPPSIFTMRLDIRNVAPTATLVYPAVVDQGSTVTLALANVFDPSPTDTAAGFNHYLSCEPFNRSSDSSAASLSCTFPYRTTVTVIGRIHDNNHQNEYVGSITVRNIPPAVTITAPANGSVLPAPSIVNVSAAFTDPGIYDNHVCEINWGDGTVAQPGVLHETLVDGTGTCTGSRLLGAGSYTIKVTVFDITADAPDNYSTERQVAVVIANPNPNVPPVISGVAGPTGPVALGNTATVQAVFTDANTADSHTCTFTWDDGTGTPPALPPGVVTEAHGSGSCNATHSYAAAGVYSVEVTVTDNHGATARRIFEYVVIYDPTAGFVTGGGWIDSPAGAYRPDPGLSGRASFGFVAKYQKGKSVPSGQTEFQLHMAGMKFQSTNYEWLVVAGSKAQYKGTGVVNGAGSYTFMLTAADGEIQNGGGSDRFRIKIIDTATNTLVYDNVGGSDDFDTANPQVIQGGSIVIHSK
jgi:alpha-tubulin suppressor-like RCC1 family protein/PKD repeat protein